MEKNLKNQNFEISKIKKKFEISKNIIKITNKHLDTKNVEISNFDKMKTFSTLKNFDFEKNLKKKNFEEKNFSENFISKNSFKESLEILEMDFGKINSFFGNKKKIEKKKKIFLILKI